MDDVTLGELGRRFDRLELRMDKQFEGVHKQIGSLDFVSQDVFNLEMAGVKERVADIERWKRWSIRTFITACIFPIVIALILAWILSNG